MAEPTRIRAQMVGELADVRILMSHPMESGQRKDSAGQAVPAWHIQELAISLNGRTVLSAQYGPAVSKNPFLRFSLRGARAGDKLAVRWQDNRGDSRSDETTVLAAG